MNVGHLVTMADDIGNFFDGESGRGESPSSIALHIQRYWDPRMRAAIIAHVRQGRGDLQPTVLVAVKKLSR